MQIENEFISAQVLEMGAELCSLVDKSINKELIWNADPNIWARHAPLLFPIVGKLRDGKYFYRNKEFLMTQHGFARDSKFELIFQESDRIVLRLKSTERTMKSYPFNFEFEMSYQLDGKRLIQQHHVRNTGVEPMYFSLGTHPAFQLNNKEHYYLQFEQEEMSQSQLIEDGLRTGKTFDSIKGDKIYLKPGIFDRDALIFAGLKSSFVDLVSAQSGRQVRVSWENMPYLGIWAKPDAPFVCIEPWAGVADSVNHNNDLSAKEGIIELSPGSNYSNAIGFEIGFGKDT